MRQTSTSHIMRTTVDIDDPILKEIKRLQRRDGKSMGRLISDLLAQALASLKAAGSHPAPATFTWISKDMGARVDLTDKHALLNAMDTKETKQ
jgi:hypothetical protein